MVKMKIKRSIFKHLRSGLISYSGSAQPKVFLLLGARQVGKTTLMEDLVLETRGHFTEIRRFNLEYPEDLLFFFSNRRGYFTTAI